VVGRPDGSGFHPPRALRVGVGFGSPDETSAAPPVAGGQRSLCSRRRAPRRPGAAAEIPRLSRVTTDVGRGVRQQLPAAAGLPRIRQELLKGFALRGDPSPQVLIRSRGGRNVLEPDRNVRGQQNGAGSAQ